MSKSKALQEVRSLYQTVQNLTNLIDTTKEEFDNNSTSLRAQLKAAEANAVAFKWGEVEASWSQFAHGLSGSLLVVGILLRWLNHRYRTLQRRHQQLMARRESRLREGRRQLQQLYSLYQQPQQASMPMLEWKRESLS
jgi:hypothetical protein